MLNIIKVNVLLKKGQKYLDICHNLVFKLLEIIRHGEEYRCFGTLFKNSFSVLKRTINCIIVAAIEDLVNKYVVTTRDRCCVMAELVSNKWFSEHNPSGLYSMDVRIRHSKRPHENHKQCKPCFSGKHRFYGYNTEVSVSPNCFALFIGLHFPASKFIHLSSERFPKNINSLLSSDLMKTKSAMTSKNRFPGYLDRQGICWRWRHRKRFHSSKEKSQTFVDYCRKVKNCKHRFWSYYRETCFRSVVTLWGLFRNQQR